MGKSAGNSTAQQLKKHDDFQASFSDSETEGNSRCPLPLSSTSRRCMTTSATLLLGSLGTPWPWVMSVSYRLDNFAGLLRFRTSVFHASLEGRAIRNVSATARLHAPV